MDECEHVMKSKLSCSNLILFNFSDDKLDRRLLHISPVSHSLRTGSPLGPADMPKNKPARGCCYRMGHALDWKVTSIVLPEQQRVLRLD